MPFEGLFSPLHWMIIGVVALIVLGPTELPRFVRRSARLWREVEQLRRHLTNELRDVVADFDVTSAAHAEVVAPTPPDAHPSSRATPSSRSPGESHMSP